MHPSAMEAGRRFFEAYLAAGSDLSIIDVGGMDVNGTLRSAAPAGARYVSVDLSAGRGVDIVLEDPFSLPFPEGSFDAAVSTSCFEHDTMFWLTFLEMCRVTRPGGYIYLNAPSRGPYHGYPGDCWRFYPDAGSSLEAWGRRSGQFVSLVESFVIADSNPFNDFVAVFRKGEAEPRQAYIRDRTEAAYPRPGSGGDDFDLTPCSPEDIAHLALGRRLANSPAAAFRHWLRLLFGRR